MSLHSNCSVVMKLARHIAQNFVVLRLFFAQRAPAALQFLQRLFQRGRRGLAQRLKGRGFQRGAVHQPCALDQVVRLVDQQADTSSPSPR